MVSKLVNEKPNDVVIIDAVRTPMGKRGGSLSEIVTSLMTVKLTEAIFERNPVLYDHAAEFEDIIVGCCSPVGGGALDIGRVTSLGAQKIVDGEKNLPPSIRNINLPDSINIEENPFSKLALSGERGFFIKQPSGAALPSIMEAFKHV